MFPLLVFVTLLMVLIPQTGWAHGTEFIMTRLRLLENDSVVELRLVVDYLGNPLVPDEAAAHEALQNALLIKQGGKTTLFTGLAPLEFHQESTWEDAVPASLLPPPDGQDHSLLTGLWRWKPDTAEIAFSVAKGNRHDVLIWQQPARGETKSVLLLGGDVSPPVAIKLPASLWRNWLWIVSPVAVFGALMVIWKRRVK